MIPRIALVVSLLAGCRPAAPAPASDAAARRDSVLTLFDSVVAIHQAVPDTALLRRLHPAADTLMFVEGSVIHRFTGDSLLRRVVAAHRGVTSMGPTIDDRDVQFLGPHHAMLTGRERVRWTANAQSQEWEGLLTLVVERRGARWIIAGYRD